jgi:hypothetical protein
MATNLFTPILNDKTREPYFFNGRLLSGEAMTEEQRAQRFARELLTEAVGDGVVYGLTVEKKSGSTITNPIITVKSGTALNRCGEILFLKDDTEVQLVRPATATTAPAKLFETCIPPQDGIYVEDDGVYLLTISSIGAGEGLATVSGLGDTPRGCNIKYRVDAVEFRLLNLLVDKPTRDDTAHLRNRVAYMCFGVDDLLDFATDPFGAGAAEPRTLLDDIRGTQLTDCDVPLAVMYWTASGGIQFLDMWSVRRRVAHTRVSTSHQEFSDHRLALGEAMVLQFQREIGDISFSKTFVARNEFRWLPPVGLLPLAKNGETTGFSYTQFFSGKTYRPPTYIEGGMTETLIRQAITSPPINLNDPEMIWLYSIRENIQTVHGGSATVQPAMIFANANVDFFGEARFDRSHFDYSNFI